MNTKSKTERPKKRKNIKSTISTRSHSNVSNIQDVSNLQNDFETLYSKVSHCNQNYLVNILSLHKFEENLARTDSFKHESPISRLNLPPQHYDPTNKSIRMRIEQLQSLAFQECQVLIHRINLSHDLSRELDSTKSDSIKFDSMKFDSMKFDSMKFDSMKFDISKINSGRNSNLGTELMATISNLSTKNNLEDYLYTDMLDGQGKNITQLSTILDTYLNPIYIIWNLIIKIGI